MNTAFVCVLIWRAMIDGAPVGVFHCTNDQFECYVTRTDRSAWNSPFNSKCEGQQIKPIVRP
jgi:hypothetical protein